jgi:hypothetical protein
MRADEAAAPAPLPALARPLSAPAAPGRPSQLSASPTVLTSSPARPEDERTAHGSASGGTAPQAKAPGGAGQAAAARHYVATGRRVMAPIARHEIPVSKGARDTVCAWLFGPALSTAWMRMLRVVPWIAHASLLLTWVCSVLSVLSVFDTPALRGRAAAWLIVFGAPPPGYWPRRCTACRS